MKRFFIILLLFTSLFGYSQNQKSLLWEVSGNNLKQSSYLFGTSHMLCSDSFSIPEKVYKSLDLSEQIVLEIDMDEPNFMQRMQTLLMNPSMYNIANELDKSDLNLINEFLMNNYGTDMSQIGIMKPFALMSMVSVKSISCQDIINIEDEIMKLAKSKGYDIKGLEEVEDVISIFDEVPTKQQLGWIIKNIRGKDETNMLFQKLQSYYEDEDVLSIHKSINELPEYEFLSDKLINERNEKWINRIIELSNKKSSFFAFGSAHLSGEKGVIQLLRDKGYKVTPIY